VAELENKRNYDFTVYSNSEENIENDNFLKTECNQAYSELLFFVYHSDMNRDDIRN